MISSNLCGSVAAGEITPTDAAEVGKLIDSYVKVYETAELAERAGRAAWSGSLRWA
jgi:hypothetical protein